MLTASLIFLLTITLVIWQPKGLGVGWSAVFGAVLATIFGVVHLSDIPLVWQIIWNATGTFVALIVISLLLTRRGSSPGRRCMWPVGDGAADASCLLIWCYSVRWCRRCSPTTGQR